MNAMIPPPQQLDIFHDSDGRAAENQICGALIAGDFVSAARQIPVLRSVEPDNIRLAAYQDLLEHALHLMALTPATAASGADCIRRMDEQVIPLARRLLQDAAGRFLALLWRHLAGLSIWWDQSHDAQAIGHPSYCLARVPDWRGVSACLLADHRTFTSLPLTLRLIDSLHQLNQRNALILAWCHAIECFGESVEAQVRHERSGIRDLYDDYCEIDTGDGIAYLPAYLIFKHRAITRLLADFPPFSGRLTKVAIDAVRRRLDGEDELSIRMALNAIDPLLVKLWMA
jgi:hypothetical protein